MSFETPRWFSRSTIRAFLLCLSIPSATVSLPNCTCSDALHTWQIVQFRPLRLSIDGYGADAKNACLSIETVFGFGLKLGLNDCPQLLLSAAVACAETAANTIAVSWHTANLELRKEFLIDLDLYIGLAYNSLVQSKKHCVATWTGSLPSLSVSEVIWNIHQYKKLQSWNTEVRPDFRWRRFSVPSFLLDDDVLSPAPAPRGILTSAANRWTYEGRGGDLGCGPKGHCYAPSLDRALAHWYPLQRQNSSSLVSLLELGTCSGISLAAWWEYLVDRFSAAEMVGVDYDLHHYHMNLGSFEESDFMYAHRVIQGDISSLGTGRELDVALANVAPFDIIVDDASHRDNAVQTAFETLFFNEAIGLAPGGIYIVLDTQPQYRGDGTSLASFKALIDGVQWKGKTYVPRSNLEVFVAQSPDIVESWVEAVEFHRGLVIIRKRPAIGWIPFVAPD